MKSFDLFTAAITYCINASLTVRKHEFIILNLAYLYAFKYLGIDTLGETKLLALVIISSKAELPEGFGP